MGIAACFTAGSWSYDIATDSVQYIISDSHLDTQWNWDFGRTRTSLIPNTFKYQKYWGEIENDLKKLSEISESLRNIIDDMNWWQQKMPNWMLGKSDERKKMESQAAIIDKTYTAGSAVDIVRGTKDATQFSQGLIESKEPMNLLYWEDESGKHSYYTDDFSIE